MSCESTQGTDPCGGAAYRLSAVWFCAHRAAAARRVRGAMAGGRERGEHGVHPAGRGEAARSAADPSRRVRRDHARLSLRAATATARQLATASCAAASRRTRSVRTTIVRSARSCEALAAYVCGLRERCGRAILRRYRSDPRTRMGGRRWCWLVRQEHQHPAHRARARTSFSASC